MDTNTIDRIRQLIINEYAARLLVKYFIEKGFKDSFNIHVYPPGIQDLPQRVPALADKVEIEPYVESINPNEGMVKLGWNLFVTGNRRMFLGETCHRELTELRSGSMTAPSGTVVRLVATPKKIIEFISNVLMDHREMIQPSISTIPRLPSARPRIGPLWSGGYYEKRRGR